MSYVDGYVLPVPRRNLAAYRRMATDAGKVWRKFGALQYVETAADDVKPGKWTSFPQSVRLKRGEVVVFSFIVYRSKGHRNQVNARVMKEMMTSGMPADMPFDVKRMAYGGFKSLVDAGRKR